MWLNVFCAHASVIVCVLFGPLHIRSRVVSVSHRGECVASVCVCIWVCVCRSFFPLRHTVVRHCIGNINFEYQAQLFIRNTYNHTSKRLERAKKKLFPSLNNSFHIQFLWCFYLGWYESICHWSNWPNIWPVRRINKCIECSLWHQNTK